MGISYNKLWKLLIDKRMKKGDLQRAARISSSSMAKLTKGETVTTEVLVKICTALSVEPGDIMQLEATQNAQGEML
ncbi:transcriptional regulator [Synergistales bacterium]|nr:transcriptional regulator [Synergistales bacterium]